MTKIPVWPKVLTIVVSILTILWLVLFLGIYIFKMNELPISNKPSDWANFSTFVGYMILTPITTIASIAAAVFVALNFRIEAQNQKADALNREIEINIRSLENLSRSIDKNIYQEIKQQTGLHESLVGKTVEQAIDYYAGSYRREIKSGERERSLKEEVVIQQIIKSICIYLNLLCFSINTQAKLLEKVAQTDLGKSEFASNERMSWFLKYDFLVKNMDRIYGLDRMQDMLSEHFFTILLPSRTKET